MRSNPISTGSRLSRPRYRPRNSETYNRVGGFKPSWSGSPGHALSRTGRGALTNSATKLVVRASPDGYTLRPVNAAGAINATPCENLNYNFIRDAVPAADIKPN